MTRGLFLIKKIILKKYKNKIVKKKNHKMTCESYYLQSVNYFNSVNKSEQIE